MQGASPELIDESKYALESRMSKRARRNNGTAGPSAPLISNSSHSPVTFSLDSWLHVSLEQSCDNADCFDELFEEHRTEYMDTRARLLRSAADVDHQGRKIRPMTPLEVKGQLAKLAAKGSHFPSHRLLTLRLNNMLRRPYELIYEPPSDSFLVDRMEELPAPDPPNRDSLDALCAISKTPFESSFVSRLLGIHPKSSLSMRDWETRTDWMELCDEIRLHHLFKHSDGEVLQDEINAPIDFAPLRSRDLLQVHDVLERAFWPGINVEDTLSYAPEKCTVVARYKHLVVGIALLSGPDETYITYLAVRAGWEKAHIGRSMLYLLIKANPRRDITLHVSANNIAMLLYNQFCFKAEEYIIGFYDNYLTESSRSSKNAFRLRLRQ